MLKLYVLIRDDMTEAQQAVQAGHAVANLVQKMTIEELAQWQAAGEGTLIYLSVRGIRKWAEILEDGGFKHAVFSEPEIECVDPATWWDLKADGIATAIAVAPNWTTQNLLFKDLPLALGEKPVKKSWWKR